MMPLDKKGERIQGLGAFHVVPFLRWAETPLFREAYERAIDGFVAAGAILPIRITADQVQVQEYTDDRKLVFLFQHMIRGVEHFYPYTFTLEPKLVAELRLSGMWGKPN